MRTEIINVRVFVEGIRVPYVNQVSVQTYANETASASFSLPPIVGFETEELKRARVHIFWSDIDTRNSVDDDEWPLLFEGEIVADGYSKSPTSRQQVFHCAGYHTYWEQVMMYYWDTSRSNPGQAPWAQKLAVALGNERFELEANYAGVNLRNRLVTFLEDNSDIGYSSMVKKIFGDAMGVNHFYKQANSLLALDKRFVTPKDDNVELLLGRQQLLEALGKDISAQSGSQTMMDVLKSVLHVFRYQIVHNAQPPAIDVAEAERRTAGQREVDEDTVATSFEEYLETLTFDGTKFLDGSFISKTVDGLKSGFSKADLVNIPDEILVELGYPESGNQVTEAKRSEIEAKFLSSSETWKRVSNPTQAGDDKLDKDSGFEDLLAQFLLIPETEFALPPTCNVIFPQDQTGFSLDRQLMQEPTRGLSTPGTEAGVPFELILAPPELSRAVIPERPVQASNTNGFSSPVAGKQRISSRYSKARKLKSRHVNAKGRTKPHKGIDIAAKAGTAVHSIDDGKIVRAGWQGNDKKIRIKNGKALQGVGFGLRVYVQHDNGVLTRYAHLSALHVQKGARVVAGQQIGEVGSTGGSTGPHLHFETIVGGNHVNPERFLTIEGDYVVEAPKPEESEDAAPAQVEEESILEVANAPESDDYAFRDWQYLTEEEQLAGIVPFFDLGTDRAHSFMAFKGASADSKKNKLQMLNAEYQRRRYATRSLSALNGPFNPNPIAGFPSLVVDRVRSLIGTISSVNHSISVGGGQGNASTTVQISHPRYWDEGDPYFFDKGKDKDSDASTFPVYYLTSLLGTNSTDSDFFWDEVVEPWDFTERPVDKLYSQLLGSDVKGIPYQFATRDTNRSTRVAYNKAIDVRQDSIELARLNKDANWRGKPRNVNTIVGRYYYLVDQGKNGDEAEQFVKNFTKRRGVNEQYLMQTVLGATTADNGFSYGGGPFRAVYQRTILRLNEILAQTQQFRG